MSASQQANKKTDKKQENEDSWGGSGDDDDDDDGGGGNDAPRQLKIGDALGSDGGALGGCIYCLAHVVLVVLSLVILNIWLSYGQEECPSF
jgi:hypothetical protein